MEWNDSSLCIPRTCGSKTALFCTDVISVSIKKSLKEILDLITCIIVDWNVKREYCMFPGKLHEFKGNCQEFTTCILSTLGVTLNLSSGCIGLYLERMVKDGKGGFVFETKDQEVIDLMDGSKREFFSHLELDYFVQCILEKEPTFAYKFAHEYALLKSFDRAFWLRSAKKPKVETYACLTKKGKCNCPFGDPEESLSILYKTQN